eukprot:TRINITY_DN1029_c0_g2_i13.p1 TRINITY_DN1029_c0_g2~~TRINITY_DN1029_c0_g2_i13.p1  ORF type:complete len:247 (-),score=-29.03 TRINITY_DN1029_c0_g2_i13:386-1126(-)
MRIAHGYTVRKQSSKCMNKYQMLLSFQYVHEFQYLKQIFFNEALCNQTYIYICIAINRKPSIECVTLPVILQKHTSFIKRPISISISISISIHEYLQFDKRISNNENKLVIQFIKISYTFTNNNISNQQINKKIINQLILFQYCAISTHTNLISINMIKRSQLYHTQYRRFNKNNTPIQYTILNNITSHNVLNTPKRVNHCCKTIQQDFQDDIRSQQKIICIAQMKMHMLPTGCKYAVTGFIARDI